MSDEMKLQAEWWDAVRELERVSWSYPKNKRGPQRDRLVAATRALSAHGIDYALNYKHGLCPAVLANKLLPNRKASHD